MTFCNVHNMNVIASACHRVKNAIADAPHQTIGKVVGLAVFASDALSSVAYAPQEKLVILAAAGQLSSVMISQLL